MADLRVGAGVRDAASIIGKAFLIVTEEAGTTVIIARTLDIGRKPAFRLFAQGIEFFAICICLAGCHRFTFTVDAGFCGIRARLVFAAFRSRVINTFAVYAGLCGIRARFLVAAFRRAI